MKDMDTVEVVVAEGDHLLTPQALIKQ